ncbi:unnamed protein product [Brachionus calyciflorus]|uniref:SecA family profile domain-containing protein n=1 Tax=Brachionus calyciflorus TaxID=104777 RepID=A0A813PQL5_9BILA|nr:unnamed protein product [Brachionus calyciflorus]
MDYLKSKLETTKNRLTNDFNLIRDEIKEYGSNFEAIVESFNYDLDVYDQEIIKIGVSNINDRVKVFNEVENYINNKLNSTRSNQTKTNSLLLESLEIIIQHLTETSFVRFDDSLKEAVRRLTLKRTKSPVNSGPNSKFYELVPIINRCDSFKPWKEDHLNDQIKIWLKPKDDEFFPVVWKTNEQTKIEIKQEECFIPGFVSIVTLDNNLNILNMNLNEFLEIRLRFSQNDITRIIGIFDSKSITSVEELTALSDDSWNTLYQNFPTKAAKIRDEISRASSNTNSFLNTETISAKSPAEILGDWHKTLRFLYYEAEMFDKLKEVGWLSKEALDLGLKEQKNSKSFNGGPMLAQIKNAFEAFAIKPNENVSLSHGMLMYGPPGTGKTSLINVIIRKVGLKQLVKPFASTELNKGIVGETEKTIRDIIRRGDTYPYLLCCVAIDEIDAIVPKRDGNPNQRIDSLTQFLTLIGGVDDVRNVYMIGATNRFNKIDDAFLRRLSDKFYVGNLNSDERYSLLCSIRNQCDHDLNFDFLENNKLLIQVLTTNFSGAATSSLKSQILQYVSLKYKLEDKDIQISTEELIEIIHKVAFSFKVKFGGMTLAELMRKNSNIEELNKTWRKYDSFIKNSTGRVLIDLSKDVLNMQFELKNDTLFELNLLKEVEKIRFLSDIVPFLLYFCIYLNIDYVKVIDTDYKILQGAEEKSSTLNLILDCFTDFDNYDNGLLVFDGDTIVGVNDSGKIEDALTDDLSRSINDQDVWKNCIIHIFRKLIQNDKEKNANDNSNIDVHPWCIFVTSHKFLVDSFKDALKFPLTNKEADEKQRDEDNREKVRKCINCDKLFYEKDNNLDSCSYHSDFLTNIKGDYSIRLTNQQLIEIVREEKNQEIFKDYVWFCCMKEYTSSDGCLKNKHSDTESRKQVEEYKKKDFLNLENGFYSIRILHNKKFVSTNDYSTRLEETPSIQVKNEYFKFIKIGPTFDYAIKSKFNDKFVSIKSGLNHLHADCYSYVNPTNGFPNLNQVFNFVLLDLRENICAIQSKFNNFYVSVDPLIGCLRCNSTVIGDNEKFTIEKLNIKVDEFTNDELKNQLKNNLFTIQSILTNKNITIENDGFSPVKTIKEFVSKSEIFEFIPAVDGKFIIKNLSNGKYVSIDNENKIICNEIDPMNFYGVFDIIFLNLESDYSLICFKSYSNRYLSLRDLSTKILTADSNEIDESSIFRIINQNNFLRANELNYFSDLTDFSLGYYRIKSVFHDNYINVDFNSNNLLKLNSIGSVFKFVKHNVNEEISYEIISKSNDMSVTSSLEHNFLYANNYSPSQCDLEINFKFEIHNKTLNYYKIKALRSNRYLGTLNELNGREFSDLILNCLEEKNQIFKLEKIESNDLFINENDSEKILKKLNNNSFTIQTFIQSKNFYFQSIGLSVVKIGNEWPTVFEFSYSHGQIKIKQKTFSNEKYLTINDDNQLVLSNNNRTFELFDIYFLKFNPNLVCIKSSTTKTFLRADIASNSLSLEQDEIDVNEFHFFRISNQNNFMNEENNQIIDSELDSESDLDSMLQLKEEIDQMPECSEKIILGLIYELKNESEFQKSKDEIDSIISKITERLNKEDLWSYTFTTDLDFLKKYLNQQDIKETIKHLRILLKKIRVIDVKQVQQLIKSNQDDLNTLRGKSIYLLLGITGAGKSTILHYLAGSQMEIGDLNGKTSLRPINVTNRDLKKVTTSSNMKSETRQVIPVELEYSLLIDDEEDDDDDDDDDDNNEEVDDADDNLEYKKTAIFCDSPGFGDTNGTEIEISNSIILKQTIDLCSKVKPIIVVNKDLGPRFQLFPNLTHSLVEMIPDKIHIKNSVEYLFNGYNTKAEKQTKKAKSKIKKDIMKTILSIKSELDTMAIQEPEKVDYSFKQIIEDIADKMTNKMFILNPLDKKPQDILVKLCDGKFIENPSRHFKISFSAHMKQKCEEQIEKHFKCIQSCILNDEIDLALYKANELVELKEMLNNYDVNNKFQDVCFKLVENLENDFQIKTSFLCNKLDNCELVKYDDLTKYKKCLKNAKQTDLIVEKLSNDKSNKYSKIKQNLENKLKLVQTNLEKKSIATDLDSIKIDLKNLLDISKYSANNLKEEVEICEFLLKVYNESCNFIFKNIEIYADKDTTNAILTQDLNSICREMKTIKQFNQLSIDHKIDLTPIYTRLQDSLVKIFEQKSKEPCNLLSKSNESEPQETFINKNKEIYKKLNEIDFYFNLAKSNQPLQEHIPVDCVTKNYEIFLISIRDHFSKSKSLALEEIGQSFFQQIEPIFNQFVQFKENINFNRYIDTYYQELSKSLVDKIQEYRNESINIINKYKRSEISLNNLQNNLDNLLAFKWYDSYRRSCIANCFKQIEDTISETLEQFEANLKDKKISIDQFDDLKEMNDVTLKMINFEDFFGKGYSFSSKLGDKIKKRKEWLNKKLTDLFNFIRQNFSNDQNQTDSLTISPHYDLLENSYKFIQICEKSLSENFDTTFNFNETKTMLNNYLTKREKFLNENLKNSFNYLTNLNYKSNILEANTHAGTMLRILKEIETTQSFEICSKFFEEFGEKLAQKWRTRLNDKLKYMEKHFVSLREQNLNEEREDLLSALLQAKIFSYFDEYLFAQNPSFISPTTFLSLYYQYSNESNRGLQDLNEECKQHINGNRYLKLRYTLKYFAHDNEKDKGKLNQLRVYLVESLVGTLSEVKKLILSINLDQLLQMVNETNVLNNTISKIFKHLNDYSDANIYLSAFIKQEESNLNSLNKELDEVKIKFQAFIDDFKLEIIKYIKKIEFDKSESLIRVLKKFKPIADLLEDLMSQDLIKNFHKHINDSNKTTENSQGLIINLNTLDDLKSYDLKTKYQVLSSQDEFSLLKSQLDQKLVSLVKDELEKAKKSTSNSLENNQSLNNCKHIIQNYLPSELRIKYIDSLVTNTEVEIESKFLANELNTTKKYQSNLIDKSLYENLLSKYQNFIMKNDQINAEKIKSHVNEKVQEILNESEVYFSDENYQGFLDNFKNFLIIYKIFSSVLPQIKTDSTQRYEPKLNEIANNCLKEFKNSLSDPLSKLSIDKLVHSYQLIYDFSRINFAENKILISTLNQININVKDSIDENQNEFKTKLSTSFISNIEFYKVTLKLAILYEKLKETNPDINKFSLTYDLKKLKKLIIESATELASQFENVKLISDSINRFQSEYDEFFDTLFKNLNDYKKINDHFDEYDLNFSTILDKSLKKLVDDMNLMLDKTDNNLNNIITMLSTSSDLPLTEQQIFHDFMNGYYNLKSFQLKSSIFKEPSKLDLKNKDFDNYFLGKIRSKIDAYTNSVLSLDPKEAAQVFSKCKEISLTFFMFKNLLDQKLDICLNGYVQNNGGFSVIGRLAPFLTESKFGSFILTEHKIFESHQRAVFLSKTSIRNIKVVIEELKKENSDINESELENFYNEYDEIFKKVVNENLTKLDLNKISSNILTIANGIRIDPNNNIEWDKNIKKELPRLTANSFALWTLLNSKDFFKLNKNGPSTSEFLFQAHPAQVLSIARMLGIGYKNSKYYKNNCLNSCLIQIGTGQGKSITLAITAILLTLLGFEVYCVCYSKYLSDRDFDAFKELFDHLKLTEYIHYGTFYQVCELIINQHGLLRDIVSDFMFNNQIELNKNTSFNNRPKILLIDEVDVFFSKDFYGNDYKPVTNLTDSTISNLIDFIWSKRNDLNKLSFNIVQNTNEYRQLCQKLGNNWKPIIDAAIRAMITELASFKTHDYEIINGKIGYIEHDNVSFNINYGYKTLFAYYLENENKKVSDTILNKMKSILVKLGSFSLAEIPKIGFRHILGVTGTLNTLSEKQEKIIRDDYKIYLRTIIPSIYAGDRFRFDKKTDVTIASEESFFGKLTSEIQSRIVGKDEEKRAVFVFFENKNELTNFKNSTDFQKNFGHLTKILTEQANTDEKKNVITNAASSNRVVLFTKVFGRGTDFITHDAKVKKSGVHVIQAFFSDELSEEVQIKGRTARQGEPGSYSMVLLDKKLEKFQLFQDNINKLSQSEYYEVLNERRNHAFSHEYEELIKFVSVLKNKHDLSMEFFENLKSKNSNFVKNYLLKLNENSSGDAVSKTLILIDATGSMSGLLEKAKRTLQTMFERAFKILNEPEKKKKYNNASFLIKIAVYRNYNSTSDLLLQNSSWESEADNLVKFLQTIDTDGGWGNEAIEIGFWQANQEIDLSQIILIGDARANTKDEVKRKRQKHINNFKNGPFQQETYYEDELNALIAKNIRINAVYLKNGKSNQSQKIDIDFFQDVANKGNGQYKYLDLDSSDSSKTLIDLVTEQVLFSIGGDDLVHAYRSADW